MGLPRIPRFALPLQVAAVCYRRENSHVEFLLVHTNGGNKWTFPKGAPEPRLSHSQAAEREAKEEAGAFGIIEPRHFHLYVHSKGVFWQPGGVQEYVVKAFLMEVRKMREPEEDSRDPTWFDAATARVVGWRNAGNVALVVLALEGIVLTGLLGRLAGLRPAWAVFAAAVVGLSPLYFEYALQTMSDLPALVAVTACLAAQ